MGHIHDIFAKNEKARNIIRSTTVEEEEKKAVVIAQESVKMAKGFEEADLGTEKHLTEYVKKRVKAKFESKTNFKLLQDEPCFNLVTMDNNGKLYGLTAGEFDLYKPKITSIYDIKVTPLISRWKNQRWSYNSTTQQIQSLNNKKTVITQGPDRNLFLAESQGLNIQKFMIDTHNGLIRNSFTSKLITVGNPTQLNQFQGHARSSIKGKPLSQHWVVVRCGKLRLTQQSNHIGQVSNVDIPEESKIRKMSKKQEQANIKANSFYQATIV